MRLASGRPRESDAERNNITALLVVGILAFATLAVLSWRHEQPRPASFGYVVALGLWAVILVVFLMERPTFVDHGHIVAALAMFGCIIAVACINAIGFKRKQGDPNVGNRYIYVGIAMLTVFPVYLFGGKYRVLLAEIEALVLFATFWIIQTEELWDPGIRPPPPGEQLDPHTGSSDQTASGGPDGGAPTGARRWKVHGGSIS
jgi:hypothetical protein